MYVLEVGLAVRLVKIVRKCTAVYNTCTFFHVFVFRMYDRLPVLCH